MLYIPLAAPIMTYSTLVCQAVQMAGRPWASHCRITAGLPVQRGKPAIIGRWSRTRRNVAVVRAES